MYDMVQFVLIHPMRDLFESDAFILLLVGLVIEKSIALAKNWKTECLIFLLL